MTTKYAVMVGCAQRRRGWFVADDEQLTQDKTRRWLGDAAGAQNMAEHIEATWEGCFAYVQKVDDELPRRVVVNERHGTMIHTFVLDDLRRYIVQFDDGREAVIFNGEYDFE